MTASDLDGASLEGAVRPEAVQVAAAVPLQQSARRSRDESGRSREEASRDEDRSPRREPSRREPSRREGGDRARERSRSGARSADVSSRRADGSPRAGTSPSRRGSRDGEQPGPPEEVTSACSSALHRIRGAELTSLAVTSSQRGEGRSTLARGFAAVQRQEYGRRTVLLELDLERPSLAATLELGEDQPGVSDVLRGGVPLVEAVRWLDSRFGVLPAGADREEARRLLTRLRGSDLLRDLQGLCDVVVADLPPMPPYGLGDRVAGLFDEVVLVVRAGTTPLPVVRRAVAQFETPPPVVLNGKSSPIPRWLRATFGG